MREKLRMGVIGLGFIGGLHARVIHELPNAELVAVADINERVANETTKKYGCNCYTDYKAMIDKEQLDAVSITLPDELHMEATIYAAKKQINVLLEKPIAKTAAESQQIINVVNEAGRRLMIAHVLHFDPRYAQLRESINRGELGEIIHLYLKRTNSRITPERLKGKVSIFYYMGVHDFEMMCAYAKSRPVRVYCQMVKKVNIEIGCEDSVFTIVNFENGALGVIELCWALPKNNALGIVTYAEVVGAKGVGYIEIMNQGISIVTENNLFYPDTLHWPEYNGRIHGDLKEEIAHFVSSTLNGEPYIVDTQNALTAVKVIEACFESIRLSKPVDIN